MKVTMTIKKDSFTNREGRKIDFTSYTAEIGGEVISFDPRESDKKLLKFLLKGEDLEADEWAKEKEADEAESEREKIPF